MRSFFSVRGNTAVVVAAAIVLSTHACSPDAPGGAIPTHPSDGFTVALEWDPPTQDALGRPLADLAGYRLYYSTSLPPMGPEGVIFELGADPRATVDGLPAGVYFFAVTAVDVAGNESDLSSPLEVEVGP
ncbi:MAG: fibronectin type III domain-containing protein [marine benthic group bacterium]|nr:fibronectin type III domain-containing protein [Candidatus Benthicola marisminoris]